MQYMLLIHSEESRYPTLSEAEMGRLMAEYDSAWKNMVEAGILVASHRLQPTTTATTVRVRTGKVLTTDGPFAETKEQFGGYALIEVPDLDEAIRWAAKIPTAKYGSVEVRPVWVD